jgi:L-lactate dehydrogenase
MPTWTAEVTTKIGAVGKRSVRTVCAPTADLLGEKDVTVSLPRLIGGASTFDTFPLPLSPPEELELRASEEVIRTALEELDAEM